MDCGVLVPGSILNDNLLEKGVMSNIVGRNLKQRYEDVAFTYNVLINCVTKLGELSTL